MIKNKIYENAIIGNESLFLYNSSKIQNNANLYNMQYLYNDITNKKSLVFFKIEIRSFIIKKIR